MANNFDEFIRLALDIEGTGDVAKLVDALKAVGESGDAAAPKAKALADQLEKLASEDALIGTLVKEKAALQETGDALARLEFSKCFREMAEGYFSKPEIEDAIAYATATFDMKFCND